jgi:hypothetical protein
MLTRYLMNGICIEFFKSKRESFERKFGEIIYPKPGFSVNRRFITFFSVLILSVFILGGERSHAVVDTVVFFVQAVFILFVFSLIDPIHGRYLTTKGVCIRSSLLGKVVFIQWEDITKVEITESSRGVISFYTIEGKKLTFMPDQKVTKITAATYCSSPLWNV